jgi:arylsulfatase A-like enzyme
MHFSRSIIVVAIVFLGLVTWDKKSAAEPNSELAASSDAVRLQSFEKNNVIMIMVDGLRADSLVLNQDGISLAPNITRFANVGVQFTQARAASSLHVQSVATIFSGRLPTLGGSIGLFEAEPHDGEPNLARAFDAAGYYTGIISNQAAIGSYGFTRNFQDIQLATPERRRSALELTQQTQRFVNDAGSDPYFLYLHFGLALPATPDTAAYQLAITEVDAAIGELVTKLEANKNERSPLIIFAAPNGYELSEHGDIGNGWTLNEEVLRVPLIFYAPEKISPGKIHEDVGLLQLAPTLSTMFNLKETFPDAQSLFKPDNGHLVFSPPTDPLIAELIIPERVIMRSVTDGDWKYTVATRYTTPENRNVLALAHVASAQSYRNGTDQPPPLWGHTAYRAAFDLSNDPNEEHNRINEASESIKNLRDALMAYEELCAQEAIAPRLSTQAVEELPAESLEDLDSLGYL